MRKRMIRIGTVAMVWVLAGGSFGAVQDDVGNEVAVPKAIDQDLVKAGIAAMANHKRLEPGKPLEYFFVVQFGPDMNVGCGRTKLQLTTGTGSVAYQYENESVLAFPGGARVLTSFRASLRANFEPIEIYGSQWQVPPEGEGDVRKIYQHVEVGDKKVSTTTREGDRKETGEAPRPQAPFIFGFETLVTLVDREKYKEFFIRELAPETGKTRELIVELETWSDGTRTYVTRTSADTGSYQLWFDQSGRFQRWAEASFPFMFIRTSEEAFKKLAAKYRLNEISPTP